VVYQRELQVGKKRLTLSRSQCSTKDGSTPDYAKYHYDFARKQLQITLQLDDFNQVTYFQTNKSFFAGTIQSFSMGDDNSSNFLLAVSMYPDDVINELGIADLISKLNGSIEMIGFREKVFVATGPQQTFAEVQNQLRGFGEMGDLLVVLSAQRHELECGRGVHGPRQRNLLASQSRRSVGLHSCFPDQSGQFDSNGHSSLL
jgi:hypothetical protein